MGLIQDVGRQLAQSFLTMDDLVLRQSLVSQGLGRLVLSSRFPAGSVMISSNVAVRTFLAAVQVGAKASGATAAALEGVAPGAGMARTLAEKIDEEAASVGADASRLAVHAVELTGGENRAPRNPLTGEVWLGKRAPQGYTWGELVADTSVGLLGKLAALPVMMGLEAAMMMASTPAGRMTIEPTLKSMNALFDMLPGTSATRLDTRELRESLLAVESSSGASALRDVLGLAEGAMRFVFGDTRTLHQALERALEEMRLLATHGAMSELLPAVPVSATLRERARSVADHAPTKLLEALKRDSEGSAPQPGAILSAMLGDIKNLLVFVTDYPQVVTLMGVNTSILLTGGLMDISKVETYVKGDNGGVPAGPIPWSATQFESYAGKAVGGSDSAGFVPRATVHVAQDIVFSYSSEILGRERALARVERLYGKEVRERVEADVSLNLDILRTEDSKGRQKKIRAHIASIKDARELSVERARCEAQLASLDSFTRDLYDSQPKNVARRKDILRTFLSLAHQDMALRGMETSGESDRLEALRGFEAWIVGEVGTS